LCTDWIVTGELFCTQVCSRGQIRNSNLLAVAGTGLEYGSTYSVKGVKLLILEAEVAKAHRRVVST